MEQDQVGEIINDAIDRANAMAFTREPPKTLQGRISYLLRQMGSTRAVAEEIGVTPASVARYRRGARKNPPRDIAAKVDEAVRTRWQPQIRKRHRDRAAAGGITVVTRASIGYDAPGGSTDESRVRRLRVHLPADYARRVFDARDTGQGDQRIAEIVTEGIQEEYFKDGGRRANGLEITINNIDYLDVSF
ncbi:telomere-protecting terminal protein Tpg [Streptomyces diastaticus]|uniref:telomere-protecting terminal protein Tpg n=1 Tax=Streptomyces diastaticus TaxID=1956 RepID=UPI003665C838